MHFSQAFDLLMFTFLLIVQTLVAAALVGTILMQRSEGGGLGVGGSSAGLM
ncbi:MAG: preprotein translocase subunit SecG, partial [Sphingomicrobium sp.]